MDNTELSNLENYSLYRGSAKEYAKNLIEDLRSWNGLIIYLAVISPRKWHRSLVLDAFVTHLISYLFLFHFIK